MIRYVSGQISAGIDLRVFRHSAYISLPVYAVTAGLLDHRGKCNVVRGLYAEMLEPGGRLIRAAAHEVECSGPKRDHDRRCRHPGRSSEARTHRSRSSRNSTADSTTIAC